MLVQEIKFYVSTVYGLLRRYLLNRDWYSRITPNILLGALPLRFSWSKIESKEQISHILCLLEPFEVKSFVVGSKIAAARGLNYLSLPVRDFIGIPSLEQVETGIRFIDSCVRNGTSVYVHCKAGRTRSAFVVTCYLMHRDKLSTESAVEFVRSRRPHIYFPESHMAALRKYHDYFCSSNRS